MFISINTESYFYIYIYESVRSMYFILRINAFISFDDTLSHLSNNFSA